MTVLFPLFYHCIHIMIKLPGRRKLSLSFEREKRDLAISMYRLSCNAPTNKYCATKTNKKGANIHDIC
jgi:hypothetical protein